MEDSTITLLSDRFSTYQILYSDDITEEQINKLNLDSINNKVAAQLSPNSDGIDSNVVIWLAIALLAIAALLISYAYIRGKKKKEDN